MQEDCGENLQDTLKCLMVGKLLMNLEVKLGQLKAANERLNDAFKQSKDSESARLFLTLLNEEAKFINGIFTKLKINKVEVKLKRNELETMQNRVSGCNVATEPRIMLN